MATPSKALSSQTILGPRQCVYIGWALCISFLFIIIPSFSHADQSDITPDIDKRIGVVRSIETKASNYSLTSHFDTAGHTIDATLRLSDGQVAHHEYIRDQSGYLLEETVTNSAGYLFVRRQVNYGYDEAGNRTAEIVTNQRGNFLEGIFNRYTERGTLSEEIVIPDVGPVRKKIFNVQGQLTCETEFNDGKITVESKRTYDAVGRLSDVVEDSYNSRSQVKLMLRRNEEGKIMEITRETRGLPPENKWHYKSISTYTYDTIGNWVKENMQQWYWPSNSPEPVKKFWWGDSPDLITERVIVYY